MTDPATSHINAPDAPLRALLMPEFMSIGGGQMIYLRKALWLARNGHHVVVASAGGELESQLAAAGIRHITLPTLGLQGAYPMAWQQWGETIEALLHVVDEESIDVVDAHPIVPVLAARELVRRRPLGGKFEFLGGQTHLIPSDVWLDEVARGRFTTYVGAAADGIAERLHFDAHSLWMNALPVDTTRYAQRPQRTMRDDLPIGADDFVVLSVARHDADKVLHIRGLIDSVARLVEEHPNVRLVLAGDGHNHDDIVAYADALLPAHCWHALGMVSDMAWALHGADVVYAMGSACADATTAGVPVIVAPAASTLAHKYPNGYPRDELALSWMYEHDDYSTGNPVRGTTPTSIDERLTALLADANLGERVAQRALMMLQEHHDEDVLMQRYVAWLQDARAAARTAWSPPHPATPADPVDSVRLAICVPQRPAAARLPWEEWSELVVPLARHNVSAQVVEWPRDSDLSAFDAALLVDMTAGTTAQWAAAANRAGIPTLLAGHYRDERAWRSLSSALHAVLQRPSDERLRLLDSLREGTLSSNGQRIDPDPCIVGPVERAQQALVAGADVFLAVDDAEVDRITLATGATPQSWMSLPIWSNALPQGGAARAREQWQLDSLGRNELRGAAPIVCFGPVDTAGNQALAALAAGDRGVVCIGPPDPEYQWHMRSICGTDNLRIVAMPTPEDVADAIAVAHCVVHVPLVDDPHLAAVVRHAATRGTPIASSAASLLDVAEQCDRLDPASIAQAIHNACETRRSTPHADCTPTIAAQYLARATWKTVRARGASATSPSTLYERCIAIITSNEVDHLQRVLEAIAEANVSNQHIVIVDNGSTDGTAELCAMLDGDVSVVRFDNEQPLDTCVAIARDIAGADAVFLARSAAAVHSGMLSNEIPGAGEEPAAA